MLFVFLKENIELLGSVDNTELLLKKVISQCRNILDRAVRRRMKRNPTPSIFESMSESLLIFFYHVNHNIHHVNPY